MIFQKGQKAKIQDLGVGESFVVKCYIKTNLSIDMTCFGVDENNKLSDDRYMIFYNQKASPGGEVKLTKDSPDTEFQVSLSNLPSSIVKLFFTAAIDALLAAQNVAIAAETNGLGICYIGTTTYQADKLIDFFKCPKGVIPITTLVIGYPNETPELTDRLPYQGIVHNEIYTDYSSDSIDEIYKTKESLPQTAELLKINQLDNLAQIFTQKRYTKKDNILFSELFLKAIQQQGFMNNK